MVTEKDLVVVNNLKQTLGGVKEETAENNDAVYCKEQPNDFSLDIIDFEDVIADVMDETEDLFALTRTCDRFSPEYLKLCKTLVNSINYLGSAFITKVAMNEKNYPVDKMATLTVDCLYQMVSFNYRKIKDALDTKKQTGHEFDLTLYNWMLIFTNVLKRLRVTQVKALDISLGMIEPYKIIEYTRMFKPGDKSRSDTNQKSRWEPFREAPSYQIRYDILREAEAAQKAKAEDDALVNEETQKAAEVILAGTESGEAEIATAINEEQTVIEENFTHVDEEMKPSETIEEPVNSESSGEPGMTETSIKNRLSYREIMMRAAERSGHEDRHVINFTLEEIQILLADEEFRRDEPEAVKQFQEIIQYAQLTGALSCPGMPDST